jgi:hypothetical protein
VKGLAAAGYSADACSAAADVARKGVAEDVVVKPVDAMPEAIAVASHVVVID